MNSYQALKLRDRIFSACGFALRTIGMRTISTIAVWLLLLPAFATAQEWTRFRGPNGGGVSETRFPAEWSDETFLWKTDLPGVGHSSPVLWGDRLFITSGDETNGKRLLLGLDAKTGRTIWTKEYEANKHGKHQLNSFASPTPTVDAERVYHCFATPDEFLATALTHDGEEVWRRDLGSFKSGHGYGASPILVDGLLIVPNEQGGQSSLLALDAATGEIRWQRERESQVHFYTPCIHKHAGRTEVIFTNWEQGIAGLDAVTGETLWSADVFDKSHIESSIGSPVLAGDLVLGVCGWLGHGNEVIAVRPPANGGGQAEKVFRIDRGAPLCTTPLVKGDLLFLWSDNGVVTCADAATGKIHWTKRIGGVYYSSPVAAGDHVWNISADGEVIVLAASHEFQIAARHRLDEGSHATPAIARGVMYVRTFSKLHAIRGEP
jgi:outer membrane protein assembly factor BamB